MKNFAVVKDFKGYINKKDETNADDQVLVSGSQNVIINDKEKVVSRKGYTLFGAASTETNGINAEYVWTTQSGKEIALRAYGDELEIYSSDTGAWTRLANGWSSTYMDFAEWWDDAESIDVLLFVAQDSNIYEWSGGVATIGSTTTNTITKTGTSTWAEEQFYTAGNKTVVINGTEYTYTGGEGTTTLTGVSPDPTGEADGSIVLQKIVTNTNKPGSNLTNDIIEVQTNQAYVVDSGRRTVYVSANDDYTDYTFSANRLPGEGALVTLDGAPQAIITQEDSVYISAGKNRWFKTIFTLSDDLVNESLEIKQLKSNPLGGCREKDLVGKIKNDAVFISYENTLDTLGRIESIETPQQKDISDLIKNDFEAEDFTGGDIKYWRNKIYITAPVNGRMYIYDLANSYWNPPQLLNVGKLSIYGGELYGHSASSNETYKLFDDYTDNGAPIDFVAKFSYRTLGDRANIKNFDEYYSEIYMSVGSKLELQLDYDYKGSRGSSVFVIDSANEDLQFDAQGDSSLGKNPLGEQGLGSATTSLETMPKYRHYAVSRPTDFFEYQATYSTENSGNRFEILAHGPNAKMAGRQDNKLRS